MSQDKFVITTDKSKLHVVYFHNYLTNESYWAKNIPLAIVEKSIEDTLLLRVV